GDLSPDGSTLAFAGTYRGARGIFLLNTDGSETPRRLDLGAGSVGWPIWRPPDGRELLYLEWEWGVGDCRLYGVRPARSARHLIDDLGTLDYNTFANLEPSVSPDGRYLVYFLTDDGRLHNHLVDLTTGANHQLLLGPPGGNELHGLISPDGTKLLFHEAS